MTREDNAWLVLVCASVLRTMSLRVKNKTNDSDRIQNNETLMKERSLIKCK